MLRVPQMIETLTLLREQQALCEQVLSQANGADAEAVRELERATESLKREADEWQRELDAAVRRRETIATYLEMAPAERCRCGRSPASKVVDVEAVLVFAIEATEEQLEDEARLRALVVAVAALCDQCLNAKRTFLEAIAAARAGQSNRSPT